MNMSFKEKTIWVSLVSTIVIFGYYFTQAIRVFNNPKIESSTLIGLFIVIVILVIIIQIVLQSVLAVANRKEAEKGGDERDNLIEIKSIRISHYILVLGVWVTALSVLIISSYLIMANIIIFFYILSEIVGFTMQLVYYRRGI